jgi:formylmethanofuran dehydrogenase subunit E
MRKKRSVKKTKPVAANRTDKCVQCGETFNWRYQGVANGNGEYFCGPQCLHDYWKDGEAWTAL